MHILTDRVSGQISDLTFFSAIGSRVLMEIKYIYINTNPRAHFYTFKRTVFFTQIWSFPNIFEVTAGDLVQTTDPVIKQSCCFQSTTVDDLNLWVEISKPQIEEFVCNSFTVEELVDLELRVVTPISTTWGSSRFRVKSIV